MKPLKVIFNRPIYRKDILKYASKHYCIDDGMCAALRHALGTYEIYVSSREIFSKYFNLTTAITKFFATGYGGYWWSNDKYGWYYRKLYFKWLIEQYKDDKEDLRKYR